MNNDKPKDKKTHFKDPFWEREATRYEQPIPSRELIMDYLTKKHKSFSRKQLVSIFNLNSEFKKEAFRRRLRAMVRDGQLVKSRSSKYKLISHCELIKGRVIGNKEGFGFLAPEDGTTHIYLSPKEMRKVFDGDSAIIRVVNIDYKNRREGFIEKIVEHRLMQIVGRFYLENGIGFIQPDNKHIARNIIIPEEYQFNASSGQIVVAEIIRAPSSNNNVIGRIIEILGDYMAAGLEIETAIRAYSLPFEWPSEVTNELDNITKDSLNDNANRTDLRKLPFITIDGEDAKDFDDAVYCEKRNKGGWLLYVAIADVSHYVIPNTELDAEAKKRGTSVYFPNKVIPMLPSVLSNDLCSLKPNKDRLTLVCEMTLNAEGKITKYKFYSAVIHSHSRLTYKQTAELLLESNCSDKLLLHLKTLLALYKVLYQNRLQRGALNFETPEIKVAFDSEKKINRLYPFYRNDAHKIIEECMLCANICAAKFLLKNKKLALYRVHDGPKADKIADLKIFLGELGFELGGGDLPTPIDYAKIANKLTDRPDAHLLQIVLLRSLTQAFYSPDNDGHFGLAYDAYTHFTSPIRRYPDLIVHRAIKDIIEQHSKAEKTWNHEALQALGEHCSMTERRADEAVREAMKWLKCEYMLDKVGKTFSGVISAVVGFGVFVEIEDIYTEGLIHISSLKNDYYHFDPIRHRMYGERTGKIYRLGDSLKVKVVRVDLAEKQIDFELVGQGKNHPKLPQKSKKPKKLPKTSKKNNSKRLKR